MVRGGYKFIEGYGLGLMNMGHLYGSCRRESRPMFGESLRSTDRDDAARTVLRKISAHGSSTRSVQMKKVTRAE